MRQRPWMTLLAALLLGLAACGEESQPSASEEEAAPSPADAQSVEVAVSSFDLAAGDDRRFTAGLLLEDRTVMVGGEVRMDLFFFDGDEGSEGENIGTATARFLPVPGLAPDPVPSQPQPADGTEVGVYETRFDFEEPGRYGVGVAFELDGEPMRGTATFEVGEERQIVDVGEPAPTVANPTLDDDVAPGLIDSRARDGGEVPDPQLHQTTVADSVAAGNRSVVLISTPVYCVSRFCGPITEQVEAMADELPDDVDVTHIEVWEDFDDQQLHPAAAAWIQTETGGNEPWLFVVDADGTVMGRWDNVVDLDAMRTLLES